MTADPLTPTLSPRSLAIKTLDNGKSNAPTIRGRGGKKSKRLGRKHDGEPGWITIWRGWEKLNALVRGAELAVELKICG